MDSSSTSELWYYAIFFVLVLIAAGVTIYVANSKVTKEGNPEYDQKTGRNWKVLTILYTIAVIIGLLALAVYVKYFT
ncbi:hypothetical protein [Paenibacillus senegalensis]|uniref:hypothetical protein n=1 Tax=Paenibacillus senegalensis TaxID=1465766 RepID=UPI0002887A51|nr:hypothetical protein [Paenibacillus senegalensis]